MGSATGLGSIWKFFYEVGVNGGGGFVFFYLLGLAAIVFPLMLVEFAIGRRGRADATHGIALLATAQGASHHWRLIGFLGVATSFLILSFYSVIGGWAIAYAVSTVSHGLAGSDATAVQAQFDDLLASPLQVGAYHTVFMALTALTVARGIVAGIERASRVLMPLLIGLVAALAVFALIEGDAPAALRFLFAID